MITQKQYHGTYSDNLHYLHHFKVAELILDRQDGSEPTKIEYNWNAKLPDAAYWFHCLTEPHRPYKGIEAAHSFFNAESFKSG